MVNFIIFLGFILSFVLTLVFSKLAIKFFGGRGVVGVDGHKPGKPMIPEMGGTAILAGFSLATVTTLYYILYSNGFGFFDLSNIFAVLLVFILAGIIGVVDDLAKLNHKIKPVLLLLASTPLIVFGTASPEIVFPFFTLDFTYFAGFDISIFYWLIIIPIGVTGAANVTNMLAGFNGLMSALGIIACATLGIVSYVLGEYDAALIFIMMLGAQLAFLHYNK